MLFAVDDIHDIAAFATGQANLSPGRVELQTMLAAISQRARMRMRDKRITLALDAAPDVGTMVADEQRLRQALHNILGNALAFTPTGGRVALAARRDNGDIEFVIAASAADMTESDRVEMFAALRQAEGEGDVGLSLARKIVALHGGVLVVEDLPTGTSRVVVRIPAGIA